MVVAFGVVVGDGALADATGDEAIGLDVVDDFFEAGGAFLCHEEGGVEPDETEGAIVGEDFADLGLGFFLEVFVVGAGLVFFVVGGEVPGVAHAAGFVPVLGLGIVKAEFDVALGAGGGELFHGGRV